MNQAAARDDLPASLARTEQYLSEDVTNRHLLARAIDLAVALSRLDVAQAHLAQALAAYPDDPFFLFRMAEMHVLEGDWQRARVLYGALHDKHRDAPLAFGLARCHAQAGEHEASLALMLPYKDAVGLDPQQAAELVRALHHTGRMDDAVSFIAACVQQHGHVPVFCANAALALLDAGDADGAARMSTIGRASGGVQSEFDIVDGTLALARADIAAALTYLTRVAHDPQAQGRARSGIGAAHLFGGDLAVALPALEAACAALPAHIGTWQLLGWCRLLGRDLAGAEAAFDHAMALNRNFGDNHGALAAVYALRGQLALATETADKALRLDPESWSARYARMVLAGETLDRARFLTLAQRLLSTRKLPDGRVLSDLLPDGA